MNSENKVKRINPENCLAIFVDVQDYFMKDLSPQVKTPLVKYLSGLAHLFLYFKIPVLVTLERPVNEKGNLIEEVKSELNSESLYFEKDFFDLSREADIKEALDKANKNQLILVGSETDVCVLQSCLGLLELGYEVFLIEEALFSSTEKTELAIELMKACGAIFMTYKTLYYELRKAVIGSPYHKQLVERLGATPEEI